jgi:hypothetical protein
MVLDRPGVDLHRGEGRTLVQTSPKAADIFDLGEDYYLDWPGENSNPGCRYEEDYLRIRGDDDPVVYARVAKEEGHHGIALQYFFFYYYNDFINKHEGDWEGIQITFKAESAQEALGEEPDHVAYTGHTRGEKADWDSAKLKTMGGRPVVYVAEGSHANYFAPGRYIGLFGHGTVLGCENAESPHDTFNDIDVVMLPDEVSGTADEFAWLEYRGLWGEYDDLEQQRGVVGPMQGLRWDKPFTWDANLRDFSHRLPEGETTSLNINPLTSVACPLGAFLTLGLQDPVKLGGGVCVMLVVLGLALWAVFARRNATNHELPKKRRSVLEIGSASWRLYFEYLFLFLSIGVWTMLGALALVLLTLWALPALGTPEVEAVVNTAFSDTFVKLGFGAFMAFGTFLFIESAVTVSIGRIQEGRVHNVEMPDVDLRKVVAEVFRNRWRLLALRSFVAAVPTVGAALAISLTWGIYYSVDWDFLSFGLGVADIIAFGLALGATLVSVGCAVWLMAGWLFVEQRCLLYERPAQGWFPQYLSESKAIVSKAKARTFWILFLGIVLVLFSSSLVGAIVLFFSDEAVSSWFYPASAFLFGVVIAPFLSIGKHLFYNELVTMVEERKADPPVKELAREAVARVPVVGPSLRRAMS